MDKFLRAAAGDNPVELVRLESLVYYYADNYIKGYNGGQWSEEETDGVLHLVLPEGATVLPHQDWGDCEFSNEHIAGLAFTTLLINHLMWRAHESGDEERANTLHDWWEKLMQLIYKDGYLNDDDLAAASRFLD
jgi:hypothetical protein